MKTESPESSAAAEAGASGSTTARGAPPEAGDSPAPEQTAGDVLRDVARRAAEISEYVSYYLATKADQFKLAAREAFYFAIFVLVGLVAVVALIVAAAVLLLVGLANGIGGALGRVWLGDIIVAVVVLILLPILTRVMFTRLFGISRKQTVEKYESRKHEQQARFGHDVAQRAREPGAGTRT
jgi:uncharacterized membrane protein